MLKIADWHFTISVQLKCGNNKNELFNTSPPSDSQDGGEVLWTSKHLLKNEALVHAVNIFRAACLIFLGLLCPSAATLSDWSSIWIASGRLSSSWENGLSCISLLYVIWLNQHGWNDFMSIHEFCFISQTEKFSQCKRLANASALCDSQLGGINMTWLMLTQTEVPLGVEEVFDCEWNRAWLVQRSQWKPCRFSFTAKTDQRAAGGRFLIHRNNVSSGARSSCQRGKRSSMCGEGSCLLEKAADIQKMKNTVYIPRAMKK